MKNGKEVFKDLYNFEGFSLREICKENSVLIQLKKKGKTGICPVCNKKRSGGGREKAREGKLLIWKENIFFDCFSYCCNNNCFFNFKIKEA